MSWVRTSKRLPCPICERTKWCSISSDGTACRCTRVKSDKPSTSKDGSLAWIHRLGGPIRDLSVEAKAVRVRLSHSEVLKINERFMADDRHQALVDCSVRLGVSLDSLVALGVGVGYDKYGRRFTTWPSFNGQLEMVGIITRYDSGKKLTIKGTSNSGLFIPRPMDSDYWNRAKVILIVEGGSDVAACYTNNIYAIGKPSNTGGSVHLVKFLSRYPNCDIAVAGENDYRSPCPVHCGESSCPACWPGYFGAQSTIKALSDAGRKARLIMPTCKDMREWLSSVGFVDSDLYKELSAN